MFEVGQRVNRKEDREIVGATVLEVIVIMDENTYLIEYDEGGQGYWTEDSLVSATA
mgnify:FL=1